MSGIGERVGWGQVTVGCLSNQPGAAESWIFMGFPCVNGPPEAAEQDLMTVYVIGIEALPDFWVGFSNSKDWLWQRLPTRMLTRSRGDAKV